MSASQLSGSNLKHAGDHNQRVTLHAIRVNGPVTRAALAEHTGLTSAAIANITSRWNLMRTFLSCQQKDYPSTHMASCVLLDFLPCRKIQLLLRHMQIYCQITSFQDQGIKYVPASLPRSSFAHLRKNLTQREHLVRAGAPPTFATGCEIIALVWEMSAPVQDYTREIRELTSHNSEN